MLSSVSVVLVQAVKLCSSSSSKRFACLDPDLVLVLVLVPSLDSKNCPTRWVSLFLVICGMLEVKEHLTIALEELEWENLNVVQWKHFIESLVKPFALQTNVTSSVISLHRSNFSSSSKLLICVVLVLGLVQSCLLV